METKNKNEEQLLESFRAKEVTRNLEATLSEQQRTAAEKDSTFDLNDIKPGMSLADRARVRRAIGRAITDFDSERAAL